MKCALDLFLVFLIIIPDTSYDKACGSEQRRSSAPLTPLLGGRETPSRFAVRHTKISLSKLTGSLSVVGINHA